MPKKIGSDQLGSASGSASLTARRVLSFCFAISAASASCVVIFFFFVAARAGDAATAATTSIRTSFFIVSPLAHGALSALIIGHAAKCAIGAPANTINKA